MNLETATFGGGCFWCTEAVFQRVKGVEEVNPGYSGGDIENPTWREISSKRTNHVEVVQLKFDPKIISYKKLVEIFFMTHDPTTENQQGYDKGPQYRSVIFYHDDNQKQIAEKVREEIDSKSYYPNPIVTSIEPYKNFYEAEGYHRDFYNSNANYPYCQLIIDPKIKKLFARFENEATTW